MPLGGRWAGGPNPGWGYDAHATVLRLPAVCTPLAEICSPFKLGRAGVIGMVKAARDAGERQCPLESDTVGSIGATTACATTAYSVDSCW